MAFGAGIVIVMASLIGVITVYRVFGRLTLVWLPYLVSASAGVFTVVVLAFLLEAAHHLEAWKVILWGGLGFFLLAGLSRILPESHHHHADDCDSADSRPIHARRILTADSIHNFGDGIFIAVAFSKSPEFGLMAMFAVFIHELLQELSEFFVLRASGLSVVRALTYNFLTALTILPGITLGILLAETEEISSVLLAVSAGAFLFVVFKDLLPHAVRHARAGKPVAHSTAVVSGIALMAIILVLIPHDHSHDHDHGDGHGRGHGHDHSHESENPADHDHDHDH